VQLVDLAKKQKKESYARLSSERLKDLLSLPLADEIRIEVLNSLIAAAEAKNQDDYEKELILQLAKVNPAQDAGLQHFWDKAWSAFTRGDLNGAKASLTFIRDTYTNPNVRRQAQYWYARTVERLGQREEAAAIYRNLAAAPYADIYAIYSVSRGAPRTEDKTNPLKVKRDDWHDVAEREMPHELRLAYELTALADYRDARVEVQKNAKHSNAMYGDALMADLYNSAGNTLLMMRALRRAFPKLATVEQDSVPQYFLRMYYPIKYENTIAENAKKNGLDRYVIQGLIHQESYYNPRARSAVGATGLMQLMPPTAKEMARRTRTSSTNLEDPTTNVRLGTFYFRTLVDMFGSVNLAIASYNAGMGNVAKWRRAAPKRPMDEFLESMPFPETRNYVKRVNMLAASYRRLDQ
jgi:soluble lytic murein transglycosylase